MQPGIILFLESLGGGELLVILLFVLLFFGSKNIPSLARGLGKGIREFKDAMNGVQSEIKQGMYEIEKQANIEDRETKTPLVTEQANSTISQPEPTEKEKENPTVTTPEIKSEERSAAR